MNTNFEAAVYRWQSKLKTVALGLLVTVFAGFSSPSVMADKQVDAKSVSLHGATIENTGDFSKQTSIKKQNIKNLQLKSIYVIPPATQGAVSRGPEPAVGNGIAVSKNGIAFVPINDGRILKLDVNNTSGTNPDGTAKPVVLDTYDIVLDSRYTGASATDGDDVRISRIHPTLSNRTIYSGNYKVSFAFTATGFDFQLMGSPSAFNGFADVEQGAVLLAIDANTGNLKWKTVVDDNPYAMITNNPVVSDGVVYVGTATEMSGVTGFLPYSYGLLPGIDPFHPPYVSADKSGMMFRGALVALDEQTGQILYKTYMVPKQDYRSRAQIDADGAPDLYNGVSIWGGGNVAIDTARNSIYMGTGELFNAPIEADACEEARLATPGAAPFNDPTCLDVDQNGNTVTALTNVVEAPGVNSPSKPLPDSVVAIDKTTGAVKWSYPIHGFDVWGFGCLEPVFGAFLPMANFTVTCPPYLRGANFGLNFFAKDLDAAEQPMLIKNVKMDNGSKQDMVLIGTKGATIVALNPDNGNVIWRQDGLLGAGSLFGGGILWGSATDGERWYTRSTTSDLNIADLNNPAKKVVAGSCPVSAFDPSTGQLAGGIYAAINLKDGSLAWQRCLTAPLVDPTTLLPKLDASGNEIEAGGLTESGIAYANGALFVPGPGTPYATGFFTETLQRPYLYVLDAQTGETIKRLPLNLDGQKSTFSQKYTRPAVVGNKLILGNGLQNDYTDQSRDRRVVIYELSDK